MNVFEKRYLVWIALILLGFSYFSYKVSGLIIFCIFAIILALVYAILRHFKLMTANLRTIFVLMLCGALLGTTATGLDLYKKGYIEEKYCGVHTVRGYVSEIIAKENFYSEHAVKIEYVNGEKTALEMILVTDYKTELERGDFFECSVQIVRSEDYVNARYLRSTYSGRYTVVAVAPDYEKIELLDKELRPSLVLSDLNSKLSAKLRQIIGGEAGNLASALLLGNRHLLSDSVLRDFSRAGIYHMLALSGLHVAILIGLVDFLLKRLRLMKTHRFIIMTCISLFYVALTGFLLSACRSVIMLWIAYLAYFVRKQSDGLTSLFLAVSIVVIIDPPSVLDVGLQLSFLSTFGVIASNIIYSRIASFNCGTEISSFRKALGKIVQLLLISVCVIVATLPVITEYFGEISLATFFTNLFMGVICEVFMVFSLGVLIFPISAPICHVVGEISAYVGEFFMNVVSTVSDISGIMLSLKYPFAGVLVCLLFIASVTLFAIRVRHKWIIALPSIAFVVMLCISIFSYGAYRSDFMRVEYVEGDALVLSTANEVYICDATDGKYGNYYNFLQVVKNNCHTEIDGVVLTHYHSYHAVALQRLANNCKLYKVYLPVPQNSGELTHMRTIIRVLEDKDVNVYLYEANEPLNLLGGSLVLGDRAYVAGYAHPSVAVTYSFGEQRVTLLERPYFNTYLEDSGAFEEYINDSDYLVFGSDGRSPKESFELYENLNDNCEISFSDFDLFALSDYEKYLSEKTIYFDVKYKKYDLK